MLDRIDGTFWRRAALVATVALTGPVFFLGFVAIETIPAARRVWREMARDVVAVWRDA